jgi:hypothetical protein
VLHHSNADQFVKSAMLLNVAIIDHFDATKMLQTSAADACIRQLSSDLMRERYTELPRVAFNIDAAICIGLALGSLVRRQEYLVHRAGMIDHQGTTGVLA